ncbi:MAG: aminoglycoside phosphotransferase family protein [Clostridia bacterium]
MKFLDIVKQFNIEDIVMSIEPYGNGHINDTYFVKCEGKNNYILQRLNTTIFTNYVGLMNNIGLVCDYMQKIIAQAGGDADREALKLIPTRSGSNFLLDNNSCWRMYLNIENTIAYQIVDNADMFANSGEAFGKFIAVLDGFDAHQLCEVIPNFHNTVDRFKKLEKAIENNLSDRKEMCLEEIRFAFDRKDYCQMIVNAIDKQEIPLRVTHNDTKLNNVLMDAVSGKAVCVIDLDTIMPGSLLYDFGDSVRFGCNTALEDESDLSKVDFDINLYDAYCKGFLSGIGKKITLKELDMLHIGSIMMTYECGMRFLTDFLDGDKYFKTHYDIHNLVRARNQFRLVSRMEACSQQMIEIAGKHYSEMLSK